MYSGWIKRAWQEYTKKKKGKENRNCRGEESGESQMARERQTERKNSSKTNP